MNQFDVLVTSLFTIIFRIGSSLLLCAACGWRRREIHRISLNTFPLFSSWQWYPMMVLLSLHYLLDSSSAAVRLCSFHHAANFLFSLKIQRLIFSLTHPQRSHMPKSVWDLYYISQPHCSTWTLLICVWPCSKCGLWPCIIHHVFLLLNTIFPS